MTAAVEVEIVDGGAVSGPVCCLDAALGHHGVGVTVPQLRADQYPVHRDPGFVGEDSGHGPGTSAPDDEDVDVVVDLGQIDLVGIKDREGLDEVHDLIVHDHSLIGPDLHHTLGILPIVWMVFG